MPSYRTTRHVFSIAFAALVAACSSSTTTSSPNNGTPSDAGTASDSGGALCPGQNQSTSTNPTIVLCSLCTQTYCCPEIQVCAGDDACLNLQTCLQRCQPTDQPCVNACQNLYPNGVTHYNNLANCPPQFCSHACSEPPSGCTNVALGYTGGCEQTQFPSVWDCPSGPPEPQCTAAPSGKADEYCCLQ